MQARILIAFAGLPGTGKSTIAEKVAYRLKAIYLRIDSIEQAIRSSGVLPAEADLGPAGYWAAYRIAADNLRLGHCVIADSVNPIKITRDAYQNVAGQAGARFLEVEVTCSDKAMHRQRVEGRRPAVEGLVLPTWKQVEARHYEAWNRPHLQLDTASLSIRESVEKVESAASSLRGAKRRSNP